MPKELDPEIDSSEQDAPDDYDGWYISEVDYIAAATNALGAVEGMNVMTGADQRRIDRIRRKAIAILDYNIGELYKYLFDEGENEDEKPPA